MSQELSQELSKQISGEGEFTFIKDKKILYENDFFKIVNNHTYCDHGISISVFYKTDIIYKILLNCKGLKSNCEFDIDNYNKKYRLINTLKLKENCSCSYAGKKVLFTFEEKQKKIEKNHVFTILDQLKNVSENNNFKINCIDGEVFTNLYYLQLHSKWFKNIESFKEKNEINCEFKKETIDNFINLIYFQEKKLNNDEIIDLIFVLDYYQIDNFSDNLLKNLKINENNVLDYLIKYLDEKIIKKCIKFLKNNKTIRKKLYKDSKWKELSVEIISEILCEIDN